MTTDPEVCNGAAGNAEHRQTDCGLLQKRRIQNFTLKAVSLPAATCQAEQSVAMSTCKLCTAYAACMTQVAIALADQY